jgi:hypothetical protein
MGMRNTGYTRLSAHILNRVAGKNLLSAFMWFAATVFVTAVGKDIGK